MNEFSEIVDEIARLELTHAQRRALAASLNANSITDAAKKAGVNPSTWHRWRASSPDFAKAEEIISKRVFTLMMHEARAEWHKRLFRPAA